MKKGTYSKVLLAVMFVTLIWFTNKTLDAFIATGIEPVTLILSFFGTFGSEWLLMYLLKKAERKAKTDIEKTKIRKG